MELKITPREAFSLARRSRIILARMDAGLYYRWDLGYNQLLTEEDLDQALHKIAIAEAFGDGAFSRGNTYAPVIEEYD